MRTVDPPAPPVATQLIVLMGLFGVAQYPLYGLCVGIANAEAPDRPPARIASEMVLLFGLGTIAGPLLGSQALARSTSSLFVFIGLVLLALGTGALLIRPRIPATTRPG